MVQSDTLSHLQHLNLEDNDNEAVVLLPDKLFVAAMDGPFVIRDGHVSVVGFML